jgi:hypothetical protein
MKIPGKFKLFGTEINIVFDDNLLMREERHGEAKYRRNEIRLQSTSDE